MNVDELKIIVTDHAHRRYCERVNMISKEELENILSADCLRECYQKDDYIQVDDVWWRFELTEDRLIIFTCYGKHHTDLPAAIRWAKLHNDRIVLSEAFADL